MLATGRLAPSPTGALHLGHAFSFLIAWWSARSRAGSIVLRLEDVDATRSSPEFNQGVIDDLQWLGIDWDGRPIIQSERISTLRESAHTLLKQGDAYPCICTRAAIRQATHHPEGEETGAPQWGTVEQAYPGTCRGRFSSLAQAESSGIVAGLRFATRPGCIEVHDGIQGTQNINVEAQVGDFQILRRDKTPAYQLAVVVDDHLDGVTEVIRGRDLLESSARQIQIAQALGFATPEYFHVPLICDQHGQRLAKRHDALSLRALREAGIRAEAVVAWVAQAAGQLDGEDARRPSSPTSALQLRAAELVPRFDLRKIPRNDILVPEAFRSV